MLLQKNQHGLPFFFDEKLFEVLDNITRLAIDIQVEVWSVERGAGDQRVYQMRLLTMSSRIDGLAVSRECQNRNLSKVSKVRMTRINDQNSIFQ